MAFIAARGWANDNGTLKRRAGTPITVVTPPPVVTPPVASSGDFGTALGNFDFDGASVPAGAKFVSTSGSDSGTGTLNSPYATVEFALKAAGTGGTVVLRGGTQSSPVWIPNTGRVRSTLVNGVAINISTQGLTLMAAPGEAVGFDGSSVITGFTAASGFWSRPYVPFDWSPQYTTSYFGTALYQQAIDNDDWHLLDGHDPGGDPSQDIYWQDIDTTSALYAACHRPERVWIDGVQQYQVAKFNLLAAGKFWIDPKANKLWLGTNPTGKVVELTTLQKLFNFLGADQSMLGIGVRRYAGSQPQGGVVQFHRPRADCSYNYFVDNSMCHVSLIGAPNGIAAYDSQMTHNTMQRGKNLNWRSVRCDRLNVEQNLFLDGNDGGFNPAPSSGSWKVTYSHDVDVHHNRHGNSDDPFFTPDPTAPGIVGHGKFGWFDASILRPSVRSNESYGAGQKAYTFELTNSLTCIDNLDVRAGTESFSIVDAGGTARVWNNTSVNCGANRGLPETVVLTSFFNNGVFHVTRSGRQPMSTTPDGTYVWDSRYSTTQDATVTHALDAWPGVTQTSVDFQNNIAVNANVRALTYDEDQRSGAAFKTAAQSGHSQDHNLFQLADTLSTGTNTTYGQTFTNETFSLETASGQTAYTTLAALRAAGYEANGNLILPSAADPLDASFNLKDTSLHASAKPLPADLATLMGVTTGATRWGRVTGSTGAALPAYTTRLLSGSNTSPASLAALGDSITFGAATDGASNPKWQNSWPGRLASALAPTYGNAGTGVVLFNHAVYDTPAYDPRFTNTGSLTKQNWGYFQAGAITIPDGGTSPSSYREFTTTCTEFVLYGNSGTAGVVRVSVDGGTSKTVRNMLSGGSAVDLTPKSGTTTGHIVTAIPAGSLSQHTIRMWGDGAAVTEWGIEGNTGAGSIKVHNTAISGKSLNGFLQADSSGLGRWYGPDYLATLKHDVVLICLGVNDWQGNLTVAATTPRLTTTINAVKAYGGVPVIYVVPQPSSTQTPASGVGWSAFVAGFQQVAASTGTAILNHQKLWCADSVTDEQTMWSTANSLGKYSSSPIHPNNAGLQDMAVNGYGSKPSIKTFLGL